MTLDPADRPEWVRAINAGDSPLFSAEASRPLTLESLQAEAAARQGETWSPGRDGIALFDHPDFPAEPAFEWLASFLAVFEDEARAHLLGRVATRRFLIRLMEGRLQLMRLLRSDPGVREEEIARPIFVAGAPRTGTTILHQLLSADPAHRVPLGWELLRPVPPPSPDRDTFEADPRIELAHDELALPQTIVSGLLTAHEYGGRKPKECLSAMSFSFQSEEFTARYSVPSFAAKLERSDMRSAYEMHRLVLQVLQRRFDRVQWVLKSPVHQHTLPTLFDVYPDARVAVTHRDPTRLLASLTSLIAKLRFAHSDIVDERAIGHAHRARYGEAFERLVEWHEAGALPSDRIHHSLFQDFQERPLETVEALYRRFEMPFDDSVRAAMRKALADNPIDRHGRHAYSTESGEGEPLVHEDEFERYRATFGVPRET